MCGRLGSSLFGALATALVSCGPSNDAPTPTRDPPDVSTAGGLGPVDASPAAVDSADDADRSLDYELHVPFGPIAPGSERSEDLAGVLPNDPPIWVTRIEWSSPAGLHHSRVDAPPEKQFTFYPVFSLPVGAHAGSFSFPDGFAMPFIAHQPMVLSYHYLNATKSPIEGTVDLRVRALPAGSTPKTPIGMIAFMTLDILVPARSIVDLENTCIVDRDLSLHSMMSHSHALGRGVDAFIVGGARDGERIYSSKTWDGAEIVAFPAPISLSAGQGVRWICHYQNPTDTDVRYGASAAEEMCGVASYYSRSTGPLGFLKKPGSACALSK